MEEVAFDDPDNTSIFFISLDIQLLSVKLDQQALLSFRSVFFFIILLYIHIYIYFFSFYPYNYGGTYHFVNFIADFDECAQDTHNCSRENATCTNTEGLFNCSCDINKRRGECDH